MTPRLWLSRSSRLALSFAVLALVILLALRIPALLSAENAFQVLRQAAVQGIMAAGVTFVILAGRLDLSVGSLLSLCSVAAVGLHDVVGPGWAIAAALMLGVVVGAVNGLLVAGFRLNSLVATLGMLSVLQGVTLLSTGGRNASVVNPENTWFSWLGRGHVLGVPVPVVILAVLTVVLSILLTRTCFGRYVRATGSNETAARYSAIPTRRVIFITYLISGLMTAVAAVVMGSRVMGARNDSGTGYELTVISGIILGGTHLSGGCGSVVRSVGGILALGFIQNAGVLLGLPYYFQWIVIWAVIVGAVWVTLAVQRRRVFA